MAKSKKIVREKRVNLRFSDSEYEQVLSLSKHDKPSTYIRDFIISQKRPPRPDPELKIIRRELSRIGSNLNQIARHCNTHKVSPSTTVLIAEVEELECQLISLAGKI